LKLDQQDWQITLQPNELRSSDYKLTELSESGPRDIPGGRTKTYHGYLQNDHESKVSLTIFENTIYGFIKSNRGTYFIEPVHNFKKGGKSDQHVIYSTADVKPSDRGCGATEMHKRKITAENEVLGAERALVPKHYALQLAIASDKSMFNKYGSVEAVEAHNLGVINNIAANYDNEFDDSITFVVTQIYVVSGTANDPWTSSTVASELLFDFTDWAPTGFTAPHDLGQLWTARDFNSSTVGIAWIGTLCSEYGYHCLQDWSTNAHDLRVVTAHEIGHNLSAEHDAPGSNTIMAPTIVNTNTWSEASRLAISSSIAYSAPPGGCLSIFASNPPTADFSATPTSGCPSLQVTFSDQSSSNTAEWFWTFIGGSPSSSTAQNPVVSYQNPGTYSVKLKVTNSEGADSITKTNFIQVNGVPTANFTFAVNGRTATFTNTSTNATSYSWNFGDGNMSTAANPVHTYANDGTYNVTLTASSNCGSANVIKAVVIIGPPTANFTANPVTGCVGLQVTFTNTSSISATAWEWTFQGGTPATSTIKNPVVTYSTAGVFSVKLKATNSGGADSISKIDFIKVGPPTSNFTYSANGRTITFTNTSINATSYSWAFGDKKTSTSVSPVYTYANDGTYNVTLTATNSCGSNKVIKSIVVVSPPTANFTANPVSGCVGLRVTFTNTSSSNATGWVWTFPGGTPSTSTAKSPVVTYSSPGSFYVKLKATNSMYADSITKTDFIKVGPPNPNFTFTTSGRTVTFTNTSTTAVSYSWKFGNGKSSSEISPVHTYASNGTYNVTLTATNRCASVSVTKTVVVSSALDLNPSSTLATASIPPKVISMTSLKTINFTEVKSLSGIDMVQKIANSIANAGTYANSISSQPFSVSLSQTEIHPALESEGILIQEIAAYPNPSSGAFTVELKGVPGKTIELQIVTLLGKVVSKETADFSSGHFMRYIDLESTPPGVYLIRATLGQHSVIKKLVVE
jgi:PKD repeat protein